MKLEIDYQNEFTLEQIIMLEAHSVLNVLGTIITCIDELRKLTAKEFCFLDYRQNCAQTIVSIRQGDTFWLNNLEPLEKLSILFNAEAEEFASSAPGGDEIVWKSYEEILRMAQETLAIRLVELKLRDGSWDHWTERTPDELQNEIEDFFSRLKLHSSRKHLPTNDVEPCEQPPDHRLEIEIHSQDGATHLRIPDALRDTIRDLAANARKYTPPGGTIRIRLTQDQSGITLSVTDNGRGIPDADFPALAEFGRRGSNVLDKNSHGGGLGLSKACFIAQHFTGKLTIDSKEGEGTAITLFIPSPPSP